MSLRRPQRLSGSRYLYEPFDAAAARVDTLEQVAEARWDALERRLGSLEALLERIERRIWLALYGLSGVILAETIMDVMRPVGL